jgi:hypothetical protein
VLSKIRELAWPEILKLREELGHPWTFPADYMKAWAITTRVCKDGKFEGIGESSLYHLANMMLSESSASVFENR